MMTEDSHLLLDKVEAILEVEAALTTAIEKVSPWLDSATVNHHHPRVRPIPQSMDQVHQLLAYARVLAARTSAPAGWNPNAPLFGFSTPNPLPHQLRGGALAALQLERARQQQQLDQSKKRQVQEIESKTEEEKPQPMETEYESSTGARDPKRREVVAHEQQVDAAAAPQQRIVRQAAPQGVSMNLSDSSSSEDEDD